MIHAKQLCLLCLQHPLSVGCEVASKGVGCPMGDCDRPHHAALHGVLKAGPAGQQVRAIERCEIAFPQEKAVGGKMVIFAFVVDKLEELYETPYGGLERWHMQLGEEDEGYLRWLRFGLTG